MSARESAADSRVRSFWEHVVSLGPMAFCRINWNEIEMQLSKEARQVFEYFLDDLSRQTNWIVERTKAMRDEAERVELIGQTMRRAGLRSYTDEKGRIFVSELVPGFYYEGRQS